MKKLITLMLGIATLAGTLNAKNVFVSLSGDNSDGSSWGKAYTAIPGTGSSAIAAGDSVFVQAGTYSFSQSTTVTAAFATMAGVNYLGGFAGTETNSAQRVRSDYDNNGIIEPWEYANLTIINVTATNNAYGVVFTTNTSPVLFDGFKITGSLDAGTGLTGSAGTTVSNVIKINNFVNFKNNIISDCFFTEATSASGTNGGQVLGGILSVAGSAVTVDNCLFEKNSATITATGAQANVAIAPIAYLASSTATGGNTISNSIFRNNQVMLDYLGITVASPTYDKQRGMIIYAPPTVNATYLNTLKNIVVHNNNAIFKPKSGTANTVSLSNGALVFMDAPGAVFTADYILNCTIANNQMTQIGYGLRILHSTQAMHVILNNAVYNNKNGNTVQNIRYYQSGTVDANNSFLSNITNGGNYIVIVSGMNANNLSDLASTNTGTKAPYFSNPTTFVGYTTDGTVETSRWSIGASSYLKGNGVTNTKVVTDKAGSLFNNTTPSVGAYEYATVNINTIAGSNGSVAAVGSVDYGSVVTLSATPNSGFKFANWTVNGIIISTNPTYSFVAVGNKDITGNFNLSTSNFVARTDNKVKINGRELIFSTPEAADIYNVTGRLIAHRYKSQTAISLSDKGVYFVKFETSSDNNVQKIIVK